MVLQKGPNARSLLCWKNIWSYCKAKRLEMWNSH